MARFAERRRWWHNPLRSLLVIAVLAGGMVGVTASPAAACSGSSCQGLDPGDNGCGGLTLEGHWYTHWSVELRSGHHSQALQYPMMP